MLEPLQMRAPSKRWLALASILFVSTASLAWSFTRRRRPKNEGAPASRRKAEGRRQKADNNSGAIAADQPNSPSCPSCPSSSFVDSDNDGIPDVLELRTYQDR